MPPKTLLTLNLDGIPLDRYKAKLPYADTDTIRLYAYHRIIPETVTIDVDKSYVAIGIPTQTTEVYTISENCNGMFAKESIAIPYLECVVSALVDRGVVVYAKRRSKFAELTKSKITLVFSESDMLADIARLSELEVVN